VVEGNDTMQKMQPRVAFTLWVLLGINFMNFFDRQVLGAVGEDLKRDWHLSNKELGALGTAFTLLYAFVGVPLGHWADVGKRTRILSAGVAVWSFLTAASGLAWNFVSLFAIRLGVGVGEATCAPAANSVIGDLVPPQRRARAISLFMLGLPVGLALSYVVSGRISHQWGWRAALFVAGIPGLILAVLMLWVPEPARGTAEHHQVGGARRHGSPFLLVLSIPTMWWIIVSGALHNFNMYALGTFLSSFLIRYHGRNIAQAGDINGVIYGFGGLGILFGGWVCDRIAKRRVRGRLEVAALAVLVFVPSMFLALQCKAGNYLGFAALMLPGFALSYIYYSGVYASIQDIIEPSLRGTAMALYFFAMYFLGASLGPVSTGWITDTLARRAAISEGAPVAADGSVQISATADAIGLYHAMYVIPLLAFALVLVLLAASRTIKADHEKLQKWMEATRGLPSGTV
jgi:MFS family permease